MIVVAIILALLPAAINRWQHGTMLTPDGAYYLAMGRGEFVPRPYSLRTAARFISNWDRVTIGSMIIVAVGLYVWASSMYNPTIAVITCAFWGALPATRRMASWTTLPDASTQAALIIAAVVALWFPWIAVMVVIASQFLHERVLLYGPMLIWISSDSALAWIVAFILGLVLFAIRRKMTPAHQDEQHIPWLAKPMQYCIEEHRKVANDWRIWLLPWGITWAWLMQPTIEAIVAFVIAYGSLLVSVDRVRTYQAMPFVLVLFAAIALPAELAFLGYIFTIYIPDSIV